MTDRRLLDLLQSDTRQSLEVLAGKVHLSGPAVQRRISRLRADNVISREVAVVDAKAVGLPMTFIISVELMQERADQVDAFSQSVAAEPLVQQCYYVTGETDFIIIAVAPDMEAFEGMTRRLFFENHNVRRFTTSVVMGASHRTLSVPATYVLEQG
ncbi:Lrp/AsnC family transcriptional regulator [Castellaniella hirudinis]|uniref:Lrp/AsnC family transcriptional regulator n=1 Tax=Castellaniella hirudinis TaxID=1144617 RepID=UPI0039C4CDD6